MSDHKQARMLILMARKDLKILPVIKESEEVDDEIFGFHVQQAIEKALKAWIALVGMEYPLVHDIDVLLQILEKNGQDVRNYKPLVKYNPYAVLFRYEYIRLPMEKLDRNEGIGKATELINHIESMLP